MSTLTVLSQNLHQDRKGAWSHLEDLVAVHGVDIALVQEASRPWDLPPRWTSFPKAADEQGWRIAIPARYRSRTGEVKETRRRYASAVVKTGQFAATPREATPLHVVVEGALAISHPGQFAVCDVAVANDVKVTVISLYGLWETMADGGEIYPDATLHRAISDLAPLLQARDSQYVLIGGDLNIYSYSDGSTWSDRAFGVLERLQHYGIEICGPFRPDTEERLERCKCSDANCRHVNTFLFQSNPKNWPYQLDFFLANEALRDKLDSCWADPDPSWYQHSDHRAVFARFTF